jgi:hypothetical protein
MGIAIDRIREGKERVLKGRLIIARRFNAAVRAKQEGATSR